MDIVEIAKAVKQHRKIAGLSQSQLGRLAGVGKTAVFELEHEKETIRFDVLRKILEALNINVKLSSPVSAVGDEARRRGKGKRP
jgi:HTH-type transcriptional regulator / antitoxin HipB